MSQDGGPSESSFREYMSTLEDDELIELITSWSQKRKASSPKAADINTNDADQPSHSSSLSFQLAQEDNEESVDDLGGDDKGPIFGDYASYFATKAQNQQIEDEKFLEWNKKRQQVQGQDTKVSSIFTGCVVHVNGYTRPSIATIHKLIILNGGKFIHHLSSKGAATHIIAERLTPRKQAEFKNYKVVRPQWVLDSIERGSLQRWSDYSLIEVDYGQQRLQFRNEDQTNPHAKQDDEDESEIGPSTEPMSEIVDTTDGTTTIDSKHPDFLKQFFAKSRLHHLSTWKADLRLEFLNMVIEQSKSQGHRPTGASHRIIVHVDFDCFFATVSALKRPDIDFQNQPVCVSHGGTKPGSTADIASCNYVCRKYGVKNGMWVRQAKKLCPDLICLDYDFLGYETASKKLYEILLGLKPDCILPVSIDEALLEISSLIDDENTVEQVQGFCESLRREIYEQTRCTVSVGVSHNVLLAKLSLRKAKPNGYFYLHENFEEFLHNIPVSSLPGVGGAIVNKLISQVFPHSSSEITIGEIQGLERANLEKVFGVKTGTKLFEYAHGIDHTSIDINSNPEAFTRKSISIDINWGIRFDSIAQIDEFLFRVSEEICNKLQLMKMCTSQVTLKILKRSKGAPIEPPKFLGCGQCDSFSKSSRLGIPSDDYRTIGMEARILFRNIGCDPLELRGVSIQVTKLIEKGKEVQMRLPFARLDAPKTARLEGKEQHSDTPMEDKSMETTQLEIPSELDSSVLRELPSSIEKRIDAQRQRDKAPIVDLPRDIDAQVFEQLPPSIQEELRSELRRRNITIGERTPKRKRVYYQQVFTRTGASEVIRIISPRKSPSKSPLKKSPTKKSPVKDVKRRETKVAKVDEDVLNELPPSLRKEILEEWDEYERTNMTEFDRLRERGKLPETKFHNSANSIESLVMDDFECKINLIMFQKTSQPSKIIKLVDRWMKKTVEKGPHHRDLELFQTYLSKLKHHSHPLYAVIIERMRLISRIEPLCQRWLDILTTLIQERPTCRD